MTIGWAIVGAGMGAKPHGLALADLAPRVDVRGVYTRSPATREAFAADHGFPVATDLAALAADPTVTAALILTPPDARAEVIRPFVEQGKAILCEKPMARSVAEAEALATLCRDIPFGIVFQHRTRAASRALAERVASGALGAIHAVRVEVPWWRDQSYYDVPGRGSYARDGGGVLISQAIHTLDLMLSLTGPVAAVSAMATTTGYHRMESEDFVAAALRFQNGAIGSLMATTAAYPGGPESISLDCDKASAHLAQGTLTLNWRDGRQEVLGAASGTGGGADPMAFPFDWHRDLIAGFCDAVEAGQAPVPGAAEGLAVQRLIDAILKAAKTGQEMTV